MPTIYILNRNRKNISFLSENFQFLDVKFSIYLNRRVFVMAFSDLVTEMFLLPINICDIHKTALLAL